MKNRLKTNPDNDEALPNRRSIRLKKYDYSWPGGYFVTICIQGKRCLFGEIADNQLHLNDAGLMVSRWWAKLTEIFPSVLLDQYIVMPNHFHGIVIIVGADPRVRPKVNGTEETGAHAGAPPHTMIQWFKTMTTNEYIRSVKEYGWPRFNGKLWQRNFYEHIIRNEDDLQEIREYIANNASKWATDSDNPFAQLPK